jgi:hypothetical protein
LSLIDTRLNQRCDDISARSARKKLGLTLVRIPALNSKVDMGGGNIPKLCKVVPLLDEALSQERLRPVSTTPRSFCTSVIETFLSSNHFSPTGPVL